MSLLSQEKCQNQPQLHRRAAGGAKAFHGHHAVDDHVIRITDFRQIHNPVIQAFALVDIRRGLVDTVKAGLVLLEQTSLHVFDAEGDAGVHMGLDHRNGNDPVHLERQVGHFQPGHHDGVRDLLLPHAALVQV